MQVLDFEELINGLNVLYYGTTEQKLRRTCPIHHLAARNLSALTADTLSVLSVLRSQQG